MGLPGFIKWCRAHSFYKAMKQKYISKIKNMFYVLILFITLSCAAYVVRWEKEISERMVIKEDLYNQSVGEFVDDIIHDVRCFPVRKDKSGTALWFYEDGYGDGRTFGGKRQHEGIDIMSSDNRPGYLAVQSVCSGTVEKKGWLKLGGYRIGIRSDSGIYYYYAHLDSYADEVDTGDRVKAGDILGYMGNTGYGPEGTRGKFDVHLHFGIYIGKGEKEKSINPYHILRYADD